MSQSLSKESYKIRVWGGVKVSVLMSMVSEFLLT